MRVRLADEVSDALFYGTEPPIKLENAMRLAGRLNDDEGVQGTPDRQHRPPRYVKEIVDTCPYSPPEHPAFHASEQAGWYRELIARLIGRFDDGRRWLDTRRGEVHALHRSHAAVTDFNAALVAVEAFEASVVRAWEAGGQAAADERMRDIIAANGYEVRRSLKWEGLELRRASDPPEAPDFPEHLVTRYVKQLARQHEFVQKRKLTAAEIGTTVRQEAIAQLRHRAHVVFQRHGIDLRAYESAKRKERKARAEQEWRETHTRYAPSPKDLLLAAILDHPESGVMDLVRILRRRRTDVAKDLVLLENEGRITREKDGQKHRFIPRPETVRHNEIERPRVVHRLRVAVPVDPTFEEVEAEQEATEPPRRRARVEDDRP